MTPLVVCVTLWKRTPSEKSMPRLRNARSSSLLSASSSLGTRWGSASMIVTSAPNDFQTLANSTPMTPPPSTTTRFGIESSSSACSLVMTRPPISRPGSVRGVRAGREDDVLAAVDGRRRPARSGPASRRPSPSTTVMPRALTRPWRPLYFFATMPSRYARTPAMSMPSNVARMPTCRGIASDVGDLGRVQQRLGGDAAAVQAGAADLVLLDQGDGLAEFAARSAAA